MSKSQSSNNSKIRKFKFIICLAFGAWSLIIPNKVMAQAISLSVSPPLFELLIQPGKEVMQTYTVENNGGDTILTPKIVYFSAADEAGNIDITDDPAPDWVKYSKDLITIKNGDRFDFNVVFSPPEDSEEIDHFLTLTFESSEPADLLNENSSLYTSKIGTNILISVTKDGNINKSAEIINFSAPKIIDSLLGNLSYLVTLKNNGNSYWKPIGKITSGEKTLKLAPLNIISGANRNIFCLENENLINCNIKPKFKIGKIISTLEFSIDDDSKIYKNEVTTWSFPFSVIGVVLILLTLYRSRGILKVWRKRR